MTPMRKAVVLSHFDSSPVAVARALGITRSAVHQWRERIPLEQALKLQSLTNGVLTVDMAEYGLPAIPSNRKTVRHATA